MDKRWQRLKEIFKDASRLVPEERAAFLDKNCHGDELLHREVEELLFSFDEAGSFLKLPVIKEVAEVIIKSEDSLINQSLGHYKILSKIGSGGMGEVFLAADTKLDRKIALKILPE